MEHVEDHWDFYFTKVGERQASIFVNLGIGRVAPIVTLPHLLWVWVQLDDPGPHGMGQGDDAQTLLTIEESLASHLTTVLGAVPVGRIRTDGRFEFYFYAPSADDFEPAVRAAIEPWPRRPYSFGDQADPDWCQYRELLHPTPEELQCIRNRRVVEKLEESGDTLAEPRRVDHWIGVPDEAALELFVAQARARGFSIESSGRNDQGRGGLSYLARVHREDRVDWSSINMVTLELFGLARACGGEYDGWETAVVRED